MNAKCHWADLQGHSLQQHAIAMDDVASRWFDPNQHCDGVVSDVVRHVFALEFLMHPMQ